MFKNFSKQIKQAQKLFSMIVIVALLFGGVPNQILAQEAEAPSSDPVEVSGCMDELADNFDASATIDDGSCTYPTEDGGGTDGADGATGDSSADTPPATDGGTGGTDEETGGADGVAGETGADGTDEAATAGTEEGGTDEEVSGCTDETAENHNPEATVDDGSCTYPTEDGGSTDDGADGATGDPSADTPPATDGGTGGTDEETGGADGVTGDAGADGTDETATTTHEHVSEEIPFVIDELIGDSSPEAGGEENEEDQGRERESGAVVSIKTGVATAKGEVTTKANSNNIRSIADEQSYRDLDNYRLYQSSPNDAVVTNEVAADAYTGRNYANARNEASIVTGDAIATFNIANVVNTNIVNSDGYLYLANMILEEDMSLDLQDFFFPDKDSLLAGASNCDLNSCLAEDIEYNFAQTNHATITNQAYLEANTGDNDMYANRSDITTGNAYGAANVVNVVNTNIIDSNYRLLTFNAVGDLDGDIILPTEELFDAFFGMPNGLNQLQAGEGEDGELNVDNQNEAQINNNLDTYAESGLNDATAIDSSITTGRSESESNVLNKVNENVFGGDLMYLWIRIHGYWSGDVVGLPDGLAWEWGPEGIIIYNADTEVTPSEFLGYDRDSYVANVTNYNNVTIDNDIYIDAISGGNKVHGGLIGTITTGDTFASANVMNIANTNVIGANWTMAIVNILGDFDGNVTFSRTDLTLTGSVESNTEPIGPGSLLTFEYTVANTTSKVATNVVVTQALSGATSEGHAVQVYELGNLQPNESRTIEMTALVDDSATTATKEIVAVASVGSDEGDANPDDNQVVSRLTAFYETTDGGDTDISGCTDSTAVNYDASATIDDGSCQFDEDDSDPVPVYGCTDSGAQNYNASANIDNGSCTYKKASSGGGGSSRNDDDDDAPKAEIERKQAQVDPNSPPKLSITKQTPNAAGTIEAGVPVEYVITVTNDGGYAYDAVVKDVLKNPIGEILNTDNWELGTILPGEEIVLEYTTAYNEMTPSGTYTNTASLIAYNTPSSARPADATALSVAPAVHKIEIKGMGLAVGNVSVVAYFPQPGGGLGALVTWQTSQPSEARLHYSPTASSPFRISRPNFGYQYVSALLPGKKINHAMVLINLQPGTTYSYHVSASDGTYQSFGGPYTFRTPSYLGRLTLANQIPQVAGASISTPDQQATAVSSITVPAQSPAPQPVSQSVVATSVTPPPKPQIVSTPAPTPVPEPAPEPEPTPSGLFDKVKESVFGWFR
ncbi:hypothetical protein KC906_00290 [Candidatus Kaiserbacteria bacterium]|nr:hypothetical protein [Candidatus Kaiserbacteria bacterium]MCB9812104.1 hypothetical protein [Candidatus Nomurabacteria bacterium]